MNLIEQLRQVFDPLLAKRVPDPVKRAECLGMIRPSANLANGDYQANFAMSLAKTLGMKPQDLAKEIAAEVPKGFIEKAEVAGPGFINIKLSNEGLAKAVNEIRGDDRLGAGTAAVPKRIVIDYSGPNVAKPLHVGHLRSTVIGEALCRLLRFRGHTVIGDNHLGDWGTQFGMLLFGYKNYLDKAAYEKDKVQELSRLYKKVREEAKQADDEDEGDANNPVVKAYREETAKLHRDDAENVRLWKEFMPAALEEVNAIYRKLDVKFDHMLGESFYHPMLPGIVDDLLKKQVAKESEGAVIVESAKGQVVLIRKRDGAFTYTTTDLATIRHRAEEFKADIALYVVDFRQADHFRNLFEAAKRWGYDKIALVHVQFGSVLGEDGKPLKTREGTPVTLEYLLNEAVKLGKRKYVESMNERKARGLEVADIDDEEIDRIAERVGLGAVKYADLSQNRTSNYKFSFDKMLATEGNTATYMQYAYARCRNILRKAGVDRPQGPILIVEPQERDLVLQLLRFDEALAMAENEYEPHKLTDYLWEVAKATASFYASDNCSVLQAASPELKESRLALCDLTGRMIQRVLHLLGIETVERM